MTFTNLTGTFPASILASSDRGTSYYRKVDGATKLLCGSRGIGGVIKSALQTLGEIAGCACQAHAKISSAVCWPHVCLGAALAADTFNICDIPYHDLLKKVAGL